MAETRSQEGAHEIDVVICTRNRDASIGAAVHSVLANDHPSFRLTVIDQSTTDATGEVLAPTAAADDRLTYIHVDEAGLSRAYNTGVDPPLPTCSPSPMTTASCRRIGSRRSPPRSVRNPTATCSTARWYRSRRRGADPTAEDRQAGEVEPFDRVSSFRDGRQLCGPAEALHVDRRLRRGAGRWRALRSSQDYDLAYRTYKSGSSSCCGPRSRSVTTDGARPGTGRRCC